MSEPTPQQDADRLSALYLRLLKGEVEPRQYSDELRRVSRRRVRRAFLRGMLDPFGLSLTATRNKLDK